MTVADIELRDLADAWHLVTLLGLTSPAAAHVTDAVAALLAVSAWRQRHHRSAATLTATTAATGAAAYLL